MRNNKEDKDIPLTCPECNGTDFRIYRDNVNTLEPVNDLNGYNKNNTIYELAECIKCGVRIQTFAVKSKYHEDKSEDFEITGKIGLIEVFECVQCGQHGETQREVTDYAFTDYADYDPEDTILWKCPRHPNDEARCVDQYDKRIPFTSKWVRSPYVKPELTGITTLLSNYYQQLPSMSQLGASAFQTGNRNGSNENNPLVGGSSSHHSDADIADGGSYWCTRCNILHVNDPNSDQPSCPEWRV